jgi:hypothetical protein
VNASILAKVNAILNFPEMAADVVGSLGINAEEEFTRFVARVEGKFERQPKFQLLLRFIEDYSRLRDAELIALFRFIYASLVNNFKGELAELFARGRSLSRKCVLASALPRSSRSSPCSRTLVTSLNNSEATSCVCNVGAYESPETSSHQTKSISSTCAGTRRLSSLVRRIPSRA